MCTLIVFFQGALGLGPLGAWAGSRGSLQQWSELLAAPVRAGDRSGLCVPPPGCAVSSPMSTPITEGPQASLPKEPGRCRQPEARTLQRRWIPCWQHLFADSAKVRKNASCAQLLPVDLWQGVLCAVPGLCELEPWGSPALASPARGGF